MNPLWNLFGSSLGGDFWKFRLGQLVSLLGNQCTNIATAWWILEKTGSAKAMATVLAPAMAGNMIFLPLLGPLGDNFSRKKLIVIADLGRFVISGALAGMVYFDYFNLGLLAALYFVGSLGQALFDSAGEGIIPQIVREGKLQAAMQQSHAIMSFGGVVGGIAGGGIVAFLGIFGAFMTDAVTFLTAGISSSLIQADTVPKRNGKTSSLKSLAHWKSELFHGFRILFKIPVLLGICLGAMVINFALAPLQVALPMFVKLGKGLPAWYLGGLESSAALGAILGAVSLNWVQEHLRRRWVLIVSLWMVGLGVLLLSWSPGLFLPLLMMLLLGMGNSWANIQTNTQIALVIPDSHRSRFHSIIEFLCIGISPLGVAGASLLISQLGLSLSLLLMGSMIVIVTPYLLFVPKLGEFMEVPADEAGRFLRKHYPDVTI